ncbi:transposase DNA-binding-containing protein [Microvirga tunisiensis]|uniref:IS4/Tn5 family transposase DNA-binding protein n=1 Tax=Microvirga tunisiensis TaxID=2108360 RepID=UPI0030B90E7D
MGTSSSVRGVPWTGFCLGFPVILLIPACQPRAGPSAIRHGKAAREPDHDEGTPPCRSGDGTDATSWVERELAGCRFQDRRLGQRLRKLLTQMAGAVGGSLPLACQDWANTKAAYRFLSNPKVSEHAILQGHFQATRTRFVRGGGWACFLSGCGKYTYSVYAPEQGSTATAHTRLNPSAIFVQTRTQSCLMAEPGLSCVN